MGSPSIVVFADWTVQCQVRVIKGSGPLSSSSVILQDEASSRVSSRGEKDFISTFPLLC